MTEERMQKLADFLSSNQERMGKILDMSVEDAQKAINSEGYDFTVDELKEFSETMSIMATKNVGSELSEDALDDVSGGVVGFAIGVGVGTIIGYWASTKNRRW